MKVKELIEKLLTVDPDLEVLVSGNQGGYEDVVFNPDVWNFSRNVENANWFYDSYEETRDASEADFKGIVL